MSTRLILTLTHNDVQIKLDDICEAYFGLSIQQARKKAGAHQLPVPVYRLGGNKSPWVVHVDDLANHIDNQRKEAQSAMA